MNIYHLYSSELIWPRGLPLERIHEPPPGSAREQSIVEVEAPIQQGLINGSPDVDAIWRHIFDHPVTFSDGPSQFLASGTWCPFNSQSTWWWPMAYPLMYLPSYCSFRMTDIWRSFVAQRCLWELDLGIAFHSPEAVQERNQHNLKQDFLDEVPGYENNSFMSDWLEGTQLEGSVGSTGRNLLKCYASLVDKGVFPGQELPLVEAWLQDLNQDGHTLA
ncbi:MAG: DUF288 domain-containing protein [Pirellulaceae bacterium]|nr:DUF288 domain-containing protein [Pirellulaceae bacterium]